MDWIQLVGFGAGGLTTLSLVPQLIKTWKLRETRDLALGTYVLLLLGVLLWLSYGILKNDAPMIIANSVTVVFCSIILAFKIKYG